MKKVVFISLIAILFSACEKKEKTMLPSEVEISFSISEMMDNGLKSGNLPEWQCPTDESGELLEPVYAIVKIGTDPNDPSEDIDYTLEVFRLDDQLYTKSMKMEVSNDLDPKTYYVKNFLLYDDTGQIIMATPLSGADYSEYVQKPVVFPFEVSAFSKIEVQIEVLCFLPHLYEYFGFAWFAATEIVVRETCFFVDLCPYESDVPPEYWASSIYAGGGGLMVDEEGAIRVIVKKDGVEVPNSPFDNLNSYGTGKPLCVQYPDDLGKTEVFTFELEIWVPSTTPGVFTWQNYATFTTTDAIPLVETDNDQDSDTDNDDGVVDFVVGNCSPNSYPRSIWLGAINPIPLTFSILEDDLAVNDLAWYNNPYLWFFYDDSDDGTGHDVGVFPPDANNNFFAGPGTLPAGTGSAQIFVPMWDNPGMTSTFQPQYALATRQFIGVKLVDITEMEYSYYYDPASPAQKPVINFNVSFDGIDGWQGRLTYTLPTPPTSAQWVTVNTLTEGTWQKSGGQTWPETGGTAGKTWSTVIGDYPNAKMRITDPWFGFRVDDNATIDNTQHVDKFVFGVNGTSFTYDFGN